VCYTELLVKTNLSLLMRLKAEHYKYKEEDKMPSGFWHGVVTLALLAVSWIIYPPEAFISMNTFVLICIVSFSQFDDLDHISGWEYLKEYFKGHLKGDLIGLKVESADKWTNWMHTWQAVLGVALLSLWIGNYLPIVSQIIHIFMDGFNRANLKYPNSPLPTAMVKWLLKNGYWTFWFSETGEGDNQDYSEYTKYIEKNVQTAES
jgi:hypothetical protein